MKPGTGSSKRTRGRRRLLVAGLLILMLVPTTTGVLRSRARGAEVLTLGWTGVVRQTRSNYCGPAVVATLLGWKGREATDLEVAARAELEPGGVSLAEFARLAAHYGFPGRWFRAPTAAGLAGVPVPSVVHLTGSTGHFAILEGTVAGFVQLADPARGRVLVPIERFEREWSGRIFLFEPSVEFVHPPI